jgi:hypothetical protein
MNSISFSFRSGSLFREEHARQGVPADQKCGKRGGHRHLQQQGEQEVADGRGGVHGHSCPRVTLANPLREVKCAARRCAVLAEWG